MDRLRFLKLLMLGGLALFGGLSASARLRPPDQQGVRARYWRKLES